MQYFYNGLTHSHRNMIDSMNGGGFLSLRDDAAYEFLEKLSESSQQWDFTFNRDKSDLSSKRGGLYGAKDDSELGMKLDNELRFLCVLVQCMPQKCAHQW